MAIKFRISGLVICWLLISCATIPKIKSTVLLFYFDNYYKNDWVKIKGNSHVLVNQRISTQTHKIKTSKPKYVLDEKIKLEININNINRIIEFKTDSFPSDTIHIVVSYLPKVKTISCRLEKEKPKWMFF